MEKIVMICILAFLVDVFTIMHMSVISQVNKNISLISNVCSTGFDVALLIFSKAKQDMHILTIAIVLLIINLCFYVAIAWNKVFKRIK